jgi:hypothetical protein
MPKRPSQSGSSCSELPPKSIRQALALTMAKSSRQLIDDWLAQGRVERQPDGCLIWNGAINNGGYPIKKIKGKSWMVPRLLLTLDLGQEFTSHERAYQTCGNLRCVNPEHLQKIPYGLNTHNLAMRVGNSTTERVKRYSTVAGAPTWGSTPTMADALRFVLSAALDWLEADPDHPHLTAAIEYEGAGRSQSIKISAQMAERIEQQRLPGECDNALGKSLIEIGLQVLENKLPRRLDESHDA